MRRFSGPNLLVLTRAARPPVPSLDVVDDGDDLDADSRAPANDGKQEQRGRTAKSSLNLARVLSSLDWKKNGHCVHVTLSYWKTWPDGRDKFAAVKSALVRDLGRHVVAGVWSLEYQTERFEKFGVWVPHWHCLLWLGGVEAASFEPWLRIWWARFSGNSSVYGVHVASGDQARGTWYLAMHAAKAAQSPPFRVGRWWGYVNRSALLGAQDLPCAGDSSDAENVWWCRLYRRSRRIKVRQRGRMAQGISWFLPRAQQCSAHAWICQHVERIRAERFKVPNPF